MLKNNYHALDHFHNNFINYKFVKLDDENFN